MILVVAGNGTEYRRWLEERGLPRRGTQFHRYVFSPQSLLGARPEKIIFTGTWYARGDIYEIRETVARMAVAFGTKLEGV